VERREGVGALVRGRVLWLGLATRERGDGKGEGECFSVRELGLARESVFHRFLFIPSTQNTG
jgi:hypothetical protein